MKKVEILVVNSLDKSVPEERVREVLATHGEADVFRLLVPATSDEVSELIGVHVIVREVAEA